MPKGVYEHKKGRKLSEEARKKMSQSRMGRPGTTKGRKLSEEHKRKISLALVGRKGHSHTEETKKKLSKAHTGRKGPLHTEEAKNKIRKAHRGKEHSIEWRQNFSRSFKGRPGTWIGRKHTEETKQKMSLAKGGTGIPYENREYSEEFYRIRKKILKRDNYICQLCWNYGDNVHHINYQKSDNRMENLICLCYKCNLKVNNKRIYWENYFIDLIAIGKEMPVNLDFIG